MVYTKNKVPLFNGNNYTLWSGRVQVHLLAQGYEVWEIIEKGFTTTQDEQAKKNMVYDAKAKDLILSGLIEYVYLKVIVMKPPPKIEEMRDQRLINKPLQGGNLLYIT